MYIIYWFSFLDELTLHKWQIMGERLGEHVRLLDFFDGWKSSRFREKVQIIWSETVHLCGTFSLQMIWAPATRSPTPDTRPLKRAASINFILPIIQMSVSSQIVFDLVNVFLWLILNTWRHRSFLFPHVPWHWFSCTRCVMQWVLILVTI